MPISLLVYIQTPIVLRVIRRLWRDVRERDRSAFYVLRQMVLEMLPGERQFIQPLKQCAGVVIKDQTSGLAQVLALLGSAAADND